MLTVDDLKALEFGDYVWIVINSLDYICKVPRTRCYMQKIEFTGEGKDDVFTCIAADTSAPFYYADYGTKWLAYKNKEEAEGVSLILPCKPGDTVYCLIAAGCLGTVLTTGKVIPREATRIIWDGKQWEIQCASSCVNRNTPETCTFYGFWNNSVFATKEQAEEKLSKIKLEAMPLAAKSIRHWKV